MDKELLYRYFAGKATEAEQDEIGRWLAEDKGAFDEYRRAQFIFEGAAVHADVRQPAAAGMQAEANGKPTAWQAGIEKGSQAAWQPAQGGALEAGMGSGTGRAPEAGSGTGKAEGTGEAQPGSMEKVPGLGEAQPGSMEKVHAQPGRRRSRFAALAIAAAAAAILFLGGGLAMKQNTIRDLSAKTVTVTTRPGERASFTLPDGSVIRLNSGTTLTYPAVFTGKERNVYIEGEAMFDVARDEDHPFVVSTFASRVKVLGTEFSVRAEKPEGVFVVYLKRGRVSVSLNGSSESLVMNPEDIVSLTDGRLMKAVQDDKSALCWLDGLVDLRCDSFKGLMDRLSKAYGVEIIVNGEGPSVDGLSGEIRISEGIEHALRSLQHVVSFTYFHEPGSQRIIINP